MKLLFKLELIFAFFLLGSVNAQNEIPDYIPPSPETSALFHVKDYTINYSTGVPAINIPLYMIKSGSLQLPVSISYDASGRRVNDVNGPIAIGWSLNSGGIISRTIFGKPDDQYSMPPSSRNLSTAELNALPNDDKYHYLSSFYKSIEDETNQYQVYDTRFDIFNYSFASKNGRFFYENLYSENGLHIMPDTSLRIEPEGGYGTGVSGFKITDTDGTKYSFGGSSGIETFKETSDVSAMKLRKMISSDLTDTIELKYTFLDHGYNTNAESYTIIDQPCNSDSVTESSFNQQPMTNSIQNYKLSRLNQIIFAGGYLNFILDSNDCIARIEVHKSNGVLLKKIIFERSNLDYPTYPTIGYTKKLTGIKIEDSQNNVIERYSFDYYNDNSVLSYRQSNRDWWGYKNGNSQTHLLPYYSIYKTDGPNGSGYETFGYGADRNPSTEVQDGLLQKITYPTGGSTEFIFEPNLYNESGVIKTAPGTRVSQIIHRNENGDVSSKETYEYNNGSFKSWYDTTPPNEQLINLFVNTTTHDVSGGFRKRTISSSPGELMSFKANRPVFYSQVTKFLGTETINIGKTVYNYDHDNPSESSAMPSLSLNSPPGVSCSWSLDNALPMRFLRKYNYWDNPVITEEKIYTNDGVDGSGNVIYNLEKKINYNYQSLNEGSIRGLIVKQFLNLQRDPTDYGNYSVEREAGENLDLPIYYSVDYWIMLGHKQLMSKSEEEYQNNTPTFSRYTSFTYNNNNLLATSTSTDSKGDQLVIRKKFSTDFSGESVFDSMISKNMIAQEVESTKTENGGTIEKKFTSYKDWGNDIIAPDKIKISKGISNLEDRIIYYDYDESGNPLELSKADGPHIVYLWGYNDQYPIAKIENTTASAVSGILGNLSAIDESDMSSINGLRTGLPNALITTYTYDPLVGVTNIRDPRGKDTQYFYDSFGRLENVKDDADNLLKEFKYHYQQ